MITELFVIVSLLYSLGLQGVFGLGACSHSVLKWPFFRQVSWYPFKTDRIVEKPIFKIKGLTSIASNEQPWNMFVCMIIILGLIKLMLIVVIDYIVLLHFSNSEPPKTQARNRKPQFPNPKLCNLISTFVFSPYSLILLPSFSNVPVPLHPTLHLWSLMYIVIPKAYPAFSNPEPLSLNPDISLVPDP